MQFGILMLAAMAPATANAQVNNGAAISLTVSTLTTGTSLGVNMGTVSADRRYVGVSINPQFSVLQGIDTFRTGNISSGAGMGTPAFRPAQIGNVTFVDHDKALLAASVPALTLKQTSLKAAVRALAGATQGNFVLGLRGLEEAQVDYNAPRDFVIPAGTVKDDLLALLKIGAPGTDMVVTAEDKVIQVSTQAQADTAIVTRTYYLEDLLANVPRFVAGNTNLNNLNAASKGAAQGSGSQGSPSQVAQAGAAQKKPPVSTDIAELITSTVRPEIWKVNGGKYGEISVVGNHVTIKAPLSVHALLEGPKVYNPNQVPMYIQMGM